MMYRPVDLSLLAIGQPHPQMQVDARLRESEKLMRELQMLQSRM